MDNDSCGSGVSWRLGQPWAPRCVCASETAHAFRWALPSSVLARSSARVEARRLPHMPSLHPPLFFTPAPLCQKLVSQCAMHPPYSTSQTERSDGDEPMSVSVEMSCCGALWCVVLLKRHSSIVRVPGRYVLSSIDAAPSSSPLFQGRCR